MRMWGISDPSSSRGTRAARAYVAAFVLSSLFGFACQPEAGSSPGKATATKAPATSPQPASTVVRTETQPAPPAVIAPPETSSTSRTADKSVPSFAIYTLSRGKGVPPQARAALRQALELAELDLKHGVRVTIETTRIGLEGETRLCIDYKDSKRGTQAYERVRAMVKGIDLINVVPEPCTTAAQPR
jgi:hypothetical protein